MTDPYTDAPIIPGTRVLVAAPYADPGFDVGIVFAASPRDTIVDLPGRPGFTHRVSFPTLALTPIHGPPMRDGRWYSQQARLEVLP